MHRIFGYSFLLGALIETGVAAAQDGILGRFPLSPAASSGSITDQKGATPSPGSPSKEPQRIPTRLATFGIPIVAPARTGIKEIQLHVSADQGKSWHLYYRVGAKDKYFPFKAAADGEYWFATRLIDANSKSLAEGNLRPEMKVLVDTTPPRLALSSQISDAGEVTAAWQANDPLLAAQSLKLEYQTSPNGPWRTIVVPATTKIGPNGELVGKIAFRPRELSGAVNLRGEILDQAGNQAVAVDRVMAGTVAQNKKPFEPPIAGPATTPPTQAEDEGVIAGVSKWLGGALGGGNSKTAAAADPYAAVSPSDENASAPIVGSSERRTASSWATDNMELTDKGVKRTTKPPKKMPSSQPEEGEEAPRSIAERRGPGRLASASTVREPRREENADESANRPSIQPPANSGREENKDASDELPADSNPLKEGEPEEIPPPKDSARLIPAEREEAPSSENESVNARPKSNDKSSNAHRDDRERAVESLPNEDSRTPIPSLSKKGPGEFRTRSPIASGVSGAERGPARPPATPTYRNASASREPAETSTESGRLPVGVEPIYTNNQRFGLEYDVNTVGPGGVSEVELWATRDGGSNWSRWGSDPDRRSPFEVEVDGEGVFGFRIVVMSRGGLATRPPQPGDEADQWVVVDSTKPKLALRGAGYGVDERVGQLEIAWEAEDANLTEKSVNLYYSDREEGPWTKIVGDLANQGAYYWRVDSRIPPKIFVKVEVRDGAGNLSSDQTREAIRVEGLVPSGKIRRIVPRQDSGE